MLLLDTHALIWLATDLSQLPEKSKSAIRFHAAGLQASATTSYEISLLAKCGTLNRGDDPFDRIIPTYPKVKAVWE